MICRQPEPHIIPIADYHLLIDGDLIVQVAEPQVRLDQSSTRNFTCHAEGSVLIEVGNTKVLCNATVEEGVPRFMKGEGKGWVTAEYSMLPRATRTRSGREAARQAGWSYYGDPAPDRTRFRAAVDLKMLGENTITIDCDVIQADGGTRRHLLQEPVWRWWMPLHA